MGSEGPGIRDRETLEANCAKKMSPSCRAADREAVASSWDRSFPELPVAAGTGGERQLPHTTTLTIKEERRRRDGLLQRQSMGTIRETKRPKPSILAGNEE